MTLARPPGMRCTNARAAVARARNAAALFYAGSDAGGCCDAGSLCLKLVEPEIDPNCQLGCMDLF
ncbi:unnamed protein product [Acanthoscelides obtectus]|uniref:Uncharacterized protein n=1 Tax=Acanthoscelides obtectus TaxID=200917 RepID=A0A9P0KA29_ACAOB|nr:unnamed protein product [Acanthoscelides obtectus]CAK1679953.1 hypothetical protein AOBTE_LOCUS32471 [Acanthoscelides obtectus]